MQCDRGFGGQTLRGVELTTPPFFRTPTTTLPEASVKWGAVFWTHDSRSVCWRNAEERRWSWRVRRRLLLTDEGVSRAEGVWHSEGVWHAGESGDMYGAPPAALASGEVSVSGGGGGGAFGGDEFSSCSVVSADATPPSAESSPGAQSTRSCSRCTFRERTCGEMIGNEGLFCR